MKTCPVMGVWRLVVPLRLYRSAGGGWCFWVRWTKTHWISGHPVKSEWRGWHIHAGKVKPL